MARRPVLPALMLLGGAVLAAVSLVIPAQAERRYGPPAATLSAAEQFEFSARLLWYGGQLEQPLDRNGGEQTFVVAPGEGVPSIAARLEEMGLIRSASAFRDYLVYSGLDTSVQAGEYRLSAALSIVDVARALQDAAPGEVIFVILPGWRVEEIAASLASSGLAAGAEDFLAVAGSVPGRVGELPAGASAEGYLYPDAYLLPRETTARELLEAALRNFSLHVTLELREGFARQGLDVPRAVILASLVQREAVQAEEGPLIASVFLNRLDLGMKLDSDPSVQYALGYNALQGTWWTNPLTGEHLKVDSPYNTYLYVGLPPGPIANPGLSALQAVAVPAQTPYYYFRARCDGSGLHAFAETFEQHLENGCP